MTAARRPHRRKAPPPTPSEPAQKPPTGRPRKFTDPDTLESAIDAYFDACDVQGRPYTMAGLARALNCSTSTLRNYGDHPFRAEFVAPAAFVSALKSARQRVEQFTEERLHTKGFHPAGPIFSLKNNFGWKDVQQVEVQTRSISIGVLLSEDQRRIIAEQLLTTVSPLLESASALSPLDPIAVTEAQTEAKAPPNIEVSPSSVA